MTDIAVFNYSDTEVRTVVRDGEPWFVAADLPGKAQYGGYVYAAGFSHGVVKVGSTTNPSARISTHAQAGSAFGHRVEHVWVSPLHDGHTSTERQLIAIAAELSDGRLKQEWFSGVALKDLVRLAEQRLVFPAVDVAAYEARGQLLRERITEFWNETPRPRGLPGHVADFFGRDGDGYRVNDLGESGFASHGDLLDVVAKLTAASGMSHDEVMDMDWIDQVELIAMNYVRSEALRMRTWAITTGRADVLLKLRDVAA